MQDFLNTFYFLHNMTTNLNTTPQLIGLAAAGAAALGLSLSDGLLQPMGRLASLRKAKARRTATTTPVMEETPEHRAALPHMEAPAAAPAPRKAAPTAGLFDMFGEEPENDAANV